MPNAVKFDGVGGGYDARFSSSRVKVVASRDDPTIVADDVSVETVSCSCCDVCTRKTPTLRPLPGTIHPIPLTLSS